MSNADWWSKQLGTKPAPVQQPRQTNNPMPPTQQPMTQYVPPQQQAPSPSKAQSANQVQPCPECGGSNYMAVQNAAPRCYDCGYPISQSGSRYGALTGAKVEGAAKGAIGNTTGGFNPMPDGYNSQGQKI